MSIEDEHNILHRIILPLLPVPLAIAPTTVMLILAHFAFIYLIGGSCLFLLSLCHLSADQSSTYGEDSHSSSNHCQVPHLSTKITGNISDNSRGRLHTFRQSRKESMKHENIVKLDRVSPTQLHNLIFFIQQINMEELTEILHDVSDPTSSNYGKYMKSKEIAGMTESPQARLEVLSYLKAAGATIISETLHGEYITARAPVSIWERMLNTEFFTYSVQNQRTQHNANMNDEDNSIRNYIRTERYSVPTVLDAHIDSVFNTIQMPPPIVPRRGHHTQHTPFRSDFKQGITTAATFTPDGYTNPAALNYHYNIVSNKGHPRAIQGVFASHRQAYSPADLKSFQKRYYLPDQPVYKSPGGHNNTAEWCGANVDYCAEGNLDLQYMMAVSQSPTIYYYTDLGLTSTWLIEMANMVEPPLVMSISYGIEERWLDSNEMNAFNTQAIKLGVMGVTILSSSGDDGASSWSVRGHPEKCGYYPVFPNTSPYVLSVGGTQVCSVS